MVGSETLWITFQKGTIGHTPDDALIVRNFYIEILCFIVKPDQLFLFEELTKNNKNELNIY